MIVEVITPEDLNGLRELLLSDLNAMFDSNHQQQTMVQIQEVRKLLNISPETLQNLCINATLSYTKIGSIFIIHPMQLKNQWYTTK